MRLITRLLAGLLPGLFGAVAPAAAPDAEPVAKVELAFLDYLDANGALAFIESGAAANFDGRDHAAWQRAAAEQRGRLDAALTGIEPNELDVEERRAIEAVRRSLDAIAADGSTSGIRDRSCRDAVNRELDYAAMRSANGLEHEKLTSFGNIPLRRFIGLIILSSMNTKQPYSSGMGKHLMSSEQDDTPFPHKIFLGLQKYSPTSQDLTKHPSERPLCLSP